MGANAINVKDIIPQYTLYIPSSTTIDIYDNVYGHNSYAIPDNSGNFPLLNPGYVIPHQLNIKSHFIINYKFKINATLPTSTNIQNNAIINGLFLTYNPNVEIVVQPPDTTAGIGDTLYQDWNGDGIQESGEPGIAGITVELQDGSCTPGLTCLTDVTDSNGNYFFPGLPYGTYTVVVKNSTLPAGVTETGDATYPGQKCTGSQCDNQNTVILNSSHPLDLNQDFGYQGNAFIGDFVWYDVNQNGLQDDGSSSGLYGVRVYIDTNGNGVYDAGEPYAITNASGGYLISNLIAGTYTVRVDASALQLGIF